MKKVLFLCTGNSCRSQMAEGFAQKEGWEAFSAGTKPEGEVNPLSIKIMAELGIDISHHRSESVNEYLKEDFTLIATVCDNARESCPLFTGNFIHTIHYGFNDPAKAIGNHREIITVYRQVRDEIGAWVEKLNKKYI